MEKVLFVDCVKRSNVMYQICTMAAGCLIDSLNDGADQEQLEGRAREERSR